MTSSNPVHIDGLIYDKQPHGGISRHFTNLINALSQETGVDVTLYLPKECSFPTGMHQVRRRSVPGSIHLRPGRYFGPLAADLTVSRRRRFWSSASDGVFHSSYYSSPDGLRIPQVLTMQDTIFEDYPELFCTPRHVQHVVDKRRALERSNGLVFSSQFAKSRTFAHYDVGARPCLVAPYAVDPRFLLEPSEDDIRGFRREKAGGEPFLLHVGSRYLHKNVARLIEAYASWQGRGEFPLVLAGGGIPDAAELALIESCGVRDRVIVLPQLSDRELLIAYHAARAFVFPSFSEGFGFPLLEAMACGTPVAAANAASLPEVGGLVPVYFDPLDVDGIRTGLDQVAAIGREDPRWLEGRARARRRSWGQVAREYGDFYQQVAQGADAKSSRQVATVGVASVDPLPSIAIVIPAYNAEKFLERAVDSVFETGYPNTEVFIVEDGSSDSTLAVAMRSCAKFPGRCRLLRHEDGRNRGVSASRNLGVTASTSEWIAFLDADDYFLPNRFDSLKEFLANPDNTVDAIYQLAEVVLDASGFGGWGSGQFGITESLAGPALLERLLTGQCWQVGAVTIRRDLLAVTGLFDPGKRIAEDCDLWYRVAAAGHVAAGDLVQPVSVYWRHANNTYSYELKHRVDVLKAMLDAWRWAQRAGVESARLALFRSAANRYATRTIMAAREAKQPRIAARILGRMAVSGNFNYLFGYEGLRQSYAVAREIMRTA